LLGVEGAPVAPVVELGESKPIEIPVIPILR
jgi:hypothetical protein